jgi:hypothetical protein
MSPRWMMWSLLGLALLVHGCDRPMVFYSEDDQRLSAPTGVALVPQEGSPVQDVPLPDGFVVLASRSHASRPSDTRTVDHWYQGRANFHRIIDFYHEQLARHRWDKLSDDQNQGDTIVMHYYKGREDLELHITKPDRVATVHLMIRPRAAATPRPVVP